MNKILLLLVILLSAGDTYALDYLLEGTIGKYAVVMNLSIRGRDADGVYFYNSTCIDIPARGVATDDGAILYVSRYNATTGTEDTTETWQLKRNADNSWAGIWRNKKSIQYEVLLHPVAISNIKHAYAYLPLIQGFKEGDEYNYVRSSLVRIVQDSVVKKGKYSLQYFHLKNSGIRLFQITDGLDRAVADKTNALLMNKFMEHVWNYCSCTGAVSDTPAYTYEISNLFLTDNVLSIDIQVNYYCRQGAYPEFSDDALTIDMKIGKELILPDILNLTTTVAPNPLEEEKWTEYQANVYTPKLLALLKKLYPKKVTSGGDCNYTEVGSWQYIQWYITDNGLYLAPDFPHAAAICRRPDWAYIPFEVLVKYKNPRRKIVLP